MPQLIMFLVFGAINALIANNKGFNPWIWFFAGGFLGLIVILIMPSAKAALPDNQELYETRRKNGNTAGTVILVIAALAVLFLFMYIVTLNA